MDAPFDSFRELCGIVRDKRERKPLYWYTIAPWVESHPRERAWLTAFANRQGDPVPPAEMAELWTLYALSRVNDMLLLAFQQGNSREPYEDPAISLQEYLMFAESLGLKSIEQLTFSSFHHEIVEAKESTDELNPIALEAVLWPCLMLGDMMFSRAGVRVSGGARHLSKQVAESSTLYWCFHRKNRPCRDLSHGWGSNSQWGTDFRRDYQLGADLHYNVDGKINLNEPIADRDQRDDHSREQRIELLVNRCFVKTTRDDRDLWPFDDTFRAIGTG
jgi:hypothetical protein